MIKLSHTPEWGKTNEGQNCSNHEIGSPKERKRAKIVPELNSTFIQFQKQSLQETDRTRNLLKKDTRWEWTAEINEDFENLKK